MKNMKLAAWLLLAALALPTFASCGETAGPADEDTDPDDSVTEAETEPMDALEARKLIDDGLGEYDFDGYQFRIVSCDNKSVYLDVESTTGDVIDDAVFERNSAVEDRFDCEITVAMDKQYSEVNTFMTTSITAGEDAFDICSYHVVQLGASIPSGYYMNWYDVPNIDFSKPWWSDSTVNDLTYNGVCIAAVGDLALSAMSCAYCVFYNKTLGQNYDLPDMYAVVNDGKFTIDYLTALTKDIYADLNQNGSVDDDDLFGYTSDCYSNMNTYLWAFDNPVFRKSGDKLEFAYKTEKISSIVEKLVNTFNGYPGIRANADYAGLDGSHHGFSRDLFAKSQSVFSNGYIAMSLTHFRELKDDFGILPYPKWDEAQKEYITMSDGQHEVLAVPKTANDLERIGTITEALCAESYKILVPAYYDVALKVKSTRDEESIAMLDLVVNSRMFDFGYVFDAWKGCSFFLEQLVKANDTNFESFYASKSAAVEKYYNKVIEYFENYED